MAFCDNCGTKLEDGAKFCDNCGNPVSAESAPAAAPAAAPAYTPAPEAAPAPGYTPAPKKSGNGKLIGIICGAAGAAVLAVVLVLVLVLGGGGGPEGVVEKYIDAMNEGDVDAFMECLPEFLVDVLEDEGYTEDYFEEMMDSIEDEVEIIEIEVKKEGDDLDDIGQYASLMSEDDEDAFEGWAKVKAEVEVDGDEKSETFLCICLDGTWYLLIAG